MPVSQNIRKTVITAVIGAIVVIVLGLLVHNSAFDFGVTKAFNSLRPGPLGDLANAIYAAFKPTFAVVWVICISIVIAICRRSWRLGLAFALTVLVTWLPVTIMKMIFERPRPDAALLPDPLQPTPLDYSYPSGHTVIITIIVVLLVFVTTGTKLQTAMRALAPIAIVVIFCTVLIEGVHFPTDALGSVIWGITVTPLVWLVLCWVLRVGDSKSATNSAENEDREVTTSE